MQFIKRNDISSLEDLLISVKECGAAARGNKANQAMRSHTASTTHSDKKHSAASTTHSNKKQTRCHVGLHPHFTYSVGLLCFPFISHNFHIPTSYSREWKKKT